MRQLARKHDFFANIFLLLHVFFRGTPRGGLEIFPEEGGVGEVQHVAHLLGGVFPAFQQCLGFEDDVILDPFFRIPSAGFVDYDGQVFGRETHLVGIEADFPLGGVMFPDQRDEAFEDEMFPVRGFLAFRLLAVGGMPLVAVQAKQFQVAFQGFAGERRGGLPDFVPHQPVEHEGFVHLFRGEVDEGMVVGEILERNGEAHFQSIKLAVLREDDDGYPVVIAKGKAFPDGAGQHYQHVVFL